MRGLISPTIIKAIAKDPLWHDNYISLYGGKNGYDSDGFDCFGYDVHGFDRAGNTVSSYVYKKAYDEDDFEYDDGCQCFQNAFHQFGIVNIDNLFIPTLNQSHNIMYNTDYQDPLNQSSIYDLPDGFFELTL